MPVKSWLQYTDIKFCFTHNEGKFVAAEKFIRTLKNKIYKDMAPISENMSLDKLADKKLNNTYHRTIKLKPADIKSSTQIDFGIENTEEDLQIDVDDYVKISKYKDIFANIDTTNYSENKFLIKKVIILSHGHMLLVILTVKKLLKFSTKKAAKNKSNRV